MASNLFSWMQQNPDSTPEEQQAASQVFNDIDNTPSLNYRPQTPDMPVIPQDAIPQDNTVPQGASQTQNGQRVPNDNSTVSGFLGNLASLFQDPAFLQSAMAFGDSMAGNQSGFQQNMNAYSQTMDARRQEQANLQATRLKRQQAIDDRQYSQDAADRAAQRDALYKMYTPESVNTYLNSGSTSDLVEQPLTPYQQAVIDINQQKADTGQNAVDARVASNAAKNLSSLPAAFGDDADHAPKQDENGTWYVNEPNSKGQYTGYKVAGPQLQKQLSANKSSNVPSAGEQQMNSDLQYLYDQNNAGNTGSFTGQVVGRSETLQDLNSSLNGDDASRNAYRSAQRIDGMMLSQGVADAKNMGASGINTKAEAEMYFRSMPRLDYTSPNSLKTSIEQINAYTKQFNGAKRTAPNATNVTNNIPEPSTRTGSTSSIPTGWSVTRN